MTSINYRNPIDFGVNQIENNLMSISNALLFDIVKKAKAEGLDQKSIALRAGVAPETISRAKKRSSIELGTIEKLAEAVGLHIILIEAARAAPEKSRSPLADPKWGLAWSNSAISDESLVQNALIRGGFSPILEAVLHYGMKFVRQQWESVVSSDTKLSSKSKSYIDDMLKNIERGISNAQA